MELTKMQNKSQNPDPRSLLAFKGKSWSTWLNAHLSNTSQDGVNQKEPYIPDCRVTRLPYKDMGLYGVCPEGDKFVAVVCNTCGAVVKSFALKRHIELRHPGETQAFLPPKQLPVKKSRPNLLYKKPAKESVPVSSISSSVQSSVGENNTTPIVQPAVSLKQTESSPVLGAKSSLQLSPCKPPSSTAIEQEVASATNIPRRKSPNSDRKRIREKDHDGDKSTLSENSSSARTNPAQIVQTQKRGNDNSRSVLVRSSSNNISRKSPSKPVLEKYMKKNQKAPMWSSTEEKQTVHGHHREDNNSSYKVLAQNSITSNISSNTRLNSATVVKASHPISPRVESYNTKTNSLHVNTRVSPDSTDWSNVQLEDMCEQINAAMRRKLKYPRLQQKKFFF